MAAELEKQAKTPERMPLNAKLGVGIPLAAVIARIHDGFLQVTSENNVVTFRFSLAVLDSTLVPED